MVVTLMGVSGAKPPWGGYSRGRVRKLIASKLVRRRGLEL